MSLFGDTLIEKIMDYETLYKEALERAKGHYGVALHYSKNEEIQELEHIFPVLKESEDKQIYRFIDDALRGLKFDLGHFYKKHRLTQEQVLAWVEKQMEKKD